MISFICKEGLSLLLKHSTVVIPGTLAIAQGESSECFQVGVCIESYHLGAEYKSDEYACLELCKSKEKCDWSTLFQNLGLCELLYNCSSLSVEKCPECLTSPVDCTPALPQCWTQVKPRKQARVR
jgi:hypothetical protein